MRTNITEDVKLLELTPDKAAELWTHFNSIKGLFDDFRKDDYQAFLSGLFNKQSVWLERVDGNGVLYLTDVIQGLSATGHFVYWDRKLRGTELMTLKCLVALMQIIPLQKINCFIPAHAKALTYYVKKLGFKSEGKIRKWSIMNGRTFDILVYGITTSEAIEALEKLQEAKNGTVHEPDSSTVQRDGEGVRSNTPELPERSEHTSDADTEHEPERASGSEGE